MDQLSAINNNIDQHLIQLQAEGVLDEQFQQLMQLQDEGNPDFVAEVVQLYFDDSVSKIEKIQSMLTTAAPDFNELDQLVHQFKGSSASLGAQMIAQLCVRLREMCQHQNAGGCQQLVFQIREAFSLLKQKLEVFIQMETHKKQLLASLPR